MLFIDGSVETKTCVGFAAYLVVSDINLPVDILKKTIIINRFENTSSTTLELQNLLCAMASVECTRADTQFIIYTDSQNIIGLIERRDRLEQADYYSAKKVRLRHYQLYQDFYTLFDSFNITFIKVSGHKARDKKDDIDRIFALVDRAARAALRNYRLG